MRRTFVQALTIILGLATTLQLAATMPQGRVSDYYSDIEPNCAYRRARRKDGSHLVEMVIGIPLIKRCDEGFSWLLMAALDVHCPVTGVSEPVNGKRGCVFHIIAACDIVSARKYLNCFFDGLGMPFRLPECVRAEKLAI